MSKPPAIFTFSLCWLLLITRGAGPCTSANLRAGPSILSAVLLRCPALGDSFPYLPCPSYSYSIEGHLHRPIEIFMRSLQLLPTRPLLRCPAEEARERRDHFWKANREIIHVINTRNPLNLVYLTVCAVSVYVVEFCREDIWSTICAPHSTKYRAPACLTPHVHMLDAESLSRA